jgi:asparagine N-glycosylation enzyme membrane subunit Stt3
MDWKCKHTWKRSANNTKWCLLGCSIGDFGTIFAFQMLAPEFNLWAVMILAIVNGLITSIALETVILMRQSFEFKTALETAFKMSFVSMVAMEVAMNITDIILVGGVLTWWAIPIMLTVGFLTPWPYNYYRLKKFGIECH